MKEFLYKGFRVSKYLHDTIIVRHEETGITIAFDPYQVNGNVKTKVDAIFLTHDHFDHFSPKDIDVLSTNETQYIFPASILDKVKTFVTEKESYLTAVLPLEEYQITVKEEQITLISIPAYNINKKSAQGKEYHTKEKEYVGFLLRWRDTTFYFMGDTDFVPEVKAMAGSMPIDVLFAPISGTYVMTVAEAVQAVQALKPTVVVPIHYGTIVGEMAMGEEFASQVTELFPEIKVESA